MHSLQKFAIISVAGLLLVNGSSRPAFGYSGDLDSTAKHYHLAELSFATGRLSDATREYSEVNSVSKTLELDVREWYRGSACYGLASCAAYSGDTAAAKHWLDEALEHHFWLFYALETAEVLKSVVGKHYLDSLCLFWKGEYLEKSGRWRENGTTIIRPASQRHSGPRSTIVALHGGYDNLKEFASHWQKVADDLQSVIVIPSGTTRPSPVGYGWNFDMGPIDSVFELVLRIPEVKEAVGLSRLFVVGYSQGGHAAIDLALRHPDQIRGAVCIEGLNIEPLTKSVAAHAVSRKTPIFGIYGEYSYKPFFDSFLRFKEDCDNLGVRATFETVPNMVHELPENLSQHIQRAFQWFDDETISGKKPHLRNDN